MNMSTRRPKGSSTDGRLRATYVIKCQLLDEINVVQTRQLVVMHGLPFYRFVITDIDIIIVYILTNIWSKIKYLAGVKLGWISLDLHSTTSDLRSSPSDVRSPTSSLGSFSTIYMDSVGVLYYLKFLTLCPDFLVRFMHCTRADDRNSVHCVIVY